MLFFVSGKRIRIYEKLIVQKAFSCLPSDEIHLYATKISVNREGSYYNQNKTRECQERKRLLFVGKQQTNCKYTIKFASHFNQRSASNTTEHKDSSLYRIRLPWSRDNVGQCSLC